MFVGLTFIGLIKGIGFGVKIASSAATNSRVFKGVKLGAFGARLRVLVGGMATTLYKKKKL
jgi:hypothetical protein